MAPMLSFWPCTFCSVLCTTHALFICLHLALLSWLSPPCSTHPPFTACPPDCPQPLPHAAFAAFPTSGPLLSFGHKATLTGRFAEPIQTCNATLLTAPSRWYCTQGQALGCSKLAAAAAGLRPQPPAQRPRRAACRRPTCRRRLTAARSPPGSPFAAAAAPPAGLPRVSCARGRRWGCPARRTT